MISHDFVQREVKTLCSSGALGRSNSYNRLLQYLADQYVSGKTPKQTKIATDVFGKDSNFDPNQESLVRVYIHNLRQKLETYYSQTDGPDGHHLEIPKGEYRLDVVPTKNSVKKKDPSHSVGQKRKIFVFASIALFVFCSALIFRLWQNNPTISEQVAAAPFWSNILTDQIPIVVVVGDYYIFGELDETLNIGRLIREFSINSAQDLSEFSLNSTEAENNYINLDLTYLPIATAFALKDILRIVYTSEKPIRITSMSELDGIDLRSNHILYIGYISGLDKLMKFVFASSSLTIGDTYDELMNLKTGEEYISGAGIPTGGQGNYHDYGLLSMFPGPSGNQFMVVAGARDEGLMHTAYSVTDLTHIEAIRKLFVDMGPDIAPALEILYEVTGFDRMSLNGTLVHSAQLDQQRIWDVQNSIQFTR